MMRHLRQLARHKRGAVAPTIAMALFALIGAGGIAFDYARLASLDTELQQAADQAALAAASQLDRAAGARARATDAIQSNGSVKPRLAANFTRFANDGNADGTKVEIAAITFCKSFDDSVANTTTACVATTVDADARFVIVTTKVRTADFALTPIVSVFSGSTSATAVAGIQASICNVSPLMVCTANDDFPTDADIGKGIIMKTAGGASWVPGNYGLLDFGSGNTGVINALLGQGLNGCQATADTDTEPGNKNVTDAVNTRMDVYDGTGATNNPSVCNVATGSGCPAENTRKDMTLEMTYEIKQSDTLPQPTPANCGAAGTANNTNPSVAYATSFAKNTQANGFTRDSCHYTGTCAGGNFGDKNWDRTAYLAANHPGITAATVAAAVGGTATAATLTRFQVYSWELANKATGKLDPQEVGTTPAPAIKSQGSNKTYTFKKQCAFNKAKLASSNYPAQKDRRILPIISANCDNLKGKGSAFVDFVILQVFDVFLTEPSLDRTVPGTTENKEIYGEVIGPAAIQGGGSGFQYYSRSRPYLVR